MIEFTHQLISGPEQDFGSLDNRNGFSPENVPHVICPRMSPHSKRQLITQKGIENSSTRCSTINPGITVGNYYNPSKDKY